MALCWYKCTGRSKRMVLTHSKRMALCWSSHIQPMDGATAGRCVSAVRVHRPQVLDLGTRSILSVFLWLHPLIPPSWRQMYWLIAYLAILVGVVGR